MRNRRVIVLLLAAALFLLPGCGKAAETVQSAVIETVPDPTEAPAEEKTADPRSIVEELIREYAVRPRKGSEAVRKLLSRLSRSDPDLGERWRAIIDCWEAANAMPVNYDRLPSDIPTDGLCLVVLGYRLRSDGGIREELEGRLQTVLVCAAQYPDACILCTGGGTAAQDPGVTEAGQMAAWLVEHGIAEERILVEDRSMTTGQNAIFSLRLLQEQYPQVKNLALITSDYHIPWGTLLFEAERILSDGGPALVSHAAFQTEKKEDRLLSYQAAGLLELAGYEEAAMGIYDGKTILK